MENENVNEQPTYDQLMNAYLQLVQENQQMKTDLNVIRFDKLNERIKTLIELLTSNIDSSIKELAEYHLKEMLKKPEITKTEE